MIVEGRKATHSLSGDIRRSVERDGVTRRKVIVYDCNLAKESTLLDASRVQSGCRSFDVSRSNDDSRVFILYELWDDRAALDAHYARDHFKRLGMESIRPLAAARVGHLCTPIAG